MLYVRVEACLREQRVAGKTIGRLVSIDIRGGSVQGYGVQWRAGRKEGVDVDSGAYEIRSLFCWYLDEVLHEMGITPYL